MIRKYKLKDIHIVVEPSNLRASSRHSGSDHIPSRMVIGNTASITHSQVLPRKVLNGWRGSDIA
jgi:hypothetical protein